VLPRDCASQGRRPHGPRPTRSCLCSPWRPPDGEPLLRLVPCDTAEHAVLASASTGLAWSSAPVSKTTRPAVIGRSASNSDAALCKSSLGRRLSHPNREPEARRRRPRPTRRSSSMSALSRGTIGALAYVAERQPSVRWRPRRSGPSKQVVVVDAVAALHQQRSRPRSRPGDGITPDAATPALLLLGAGRGSVVAGARRRRGCWCCVKREASASTHRCVFSPEVRARRHPLPGRRSRSSSLREPTRMAVRNRRCRPIQSGGRSGKRHTTPRETTDG